MTCRWNCTVFAPDDRDAQRYGMGAMALRYAWMGYSVLPLARGGKRPHRMLGERGGVHRATRDPDEIRDLWSLDPAANVGVATGSVSRLAVVDLDVKHGVDGLESFGRFMLGPPVMPEADLALLRDAPLAVTPSGGMHTWLRVPAGASVPERPGILPGVDVKGDGGYVVAAPSLLAVTVGDRSGQGAGQARVPYEWASGCPHEAPPAPGWLLPWLEQYQSAGTPQPGHTSKPDVPDEENGLNVGSRNRSVYALACSLYRKLGTDPRGAGEVLERLRGVWEKTDKTDFSWQEVLTCAESARRFIERAKQGEDARNRAFLAWLYRRG